MFKGGFIMKNSTSFSDEEIQGIFDMIENEYYDSLSYNQILNIAKHIDDKGFKANDKLLALEYAARLRIEMSNYIEHVATNSNDLRKKQYITLEAQVVRIKNTMYPDNIDSKILYDIDNPEIDAYIQKYTIFDNPFLPKEFVDNLCKEYAGTVYYKRYILGEWALAEGLIYPMYETSIEKPPDRSAEKYIMSLDYGTQNAFAAILWGKYGDVWYALREYYYSGRDTGAQKTDEEYGEDIEKFVEDIDGNIKVTVDPSAASFIALLRKKPKFSVLKADNDVADGIRETATAMQTGRIKISPDMTNWKKEVEGYVWDDTAQEDKPVKINDHLMDAMRYFVKTFRIAQKKNTYIPIW